MRNLPIALLAILAGGCTSHIQPTVIRVNQESPIGLPVANPANESTMEKVRHLYNARLSPKRKLAASASHSYKGVPGFKHISEYSDDELNLCSQDELSIITQDRHAKMGVAKSLTARGYKVKVGLIDHLVAVLPESGKDALFRHFAVIDSFPGVKVASPRARFTIDTPSAQRLSRSLMLVPNDSEYEFNHQWYIDKIRAPLAWDSVSTISSRKIAILDSGAIFHSDFTSTNHQSILPGANATPTYTDWQGNIHEDTTSNTNTLDTYHHGTRVASVAAAITNNDFGIASTTYRGYFMPMVVAENNDGTWNYWPDNARAAAIWAYERGARVINCSFQLPVPDPHFEFMVNYANERSVPVICSTGNNGGSVGYPAKYSMTYDNVIAVGSTDANDRRTVDAVDPSGATWSSNWGEGISMVAPGEDIYTANLNGADFSPVDGTSFAAPLVSGALANLLYVCPVLPLWQVIDVVYAEAENTKSGTLPLGAGSEYTGGTYNTETGYGRLDYGGAAKFLKDDGVIYQWIKTGSASHFWTAMPNQQLSDGTYEKIAFQISKTGGVGFSLVKRYYNSALGDWMLDTTSTVPNANNYNFQSNVAYIATSPITGAYTRNVYELQHLASGTHHYTVDVVEKTILLNNGWVYNRTIGYAK